MKQKHEIEKRLKKYEDLLACADEGSDNELSLISAVDELEWVLLER